MSVNRRSFVQAVAALALIPVAKLFAREPKRQFPMVTITPEDYEWTNEWGIPETESIPPMLPGHDYEDEKNEITTK
jgi:hypothetical protein